MAFGEIDSEGHLELRGDPEALIKDNPASRLSTVTSLKLDLNDNVKEIGESIGELTNLIRLNFSWCKSLKSVPNTITRLHYLKHLEFCCECLKELPANIGQLASLSHLKLSKCNKIKYLPNSIANLSKLTSLSLCSCYSLVELPANIGQLLSLTHLELRRCGNIKSLPSSAADLPKLTSLSFSCESLSGIPSNLGQLAKTITHLNISAGSGWKELPESICQLGSLTHLYIFFGYEIKSIPKSIANLSNLTSLSLSDCHCLVELPPYLDGLPHLCILDIQNSRIRCLPWSIMKLSKLRHLMLPTYFRLQTLPDTLNNSVIISVYNRHVRKSWEELRMEMGKLPTPLVEEIPNYSFITPSGYLRLKGDPSQWIINNRHVLKLVRVLDLEDVEGLTDSITQFSELTHLYLNFCNKVVIRLPDNFFVTLTRLRHLSLEFKNIGDKSIFHSLSMLSNLESLHLSLPAKFYMPMPVSLKHLSLKGCDMRLIYDSLEKLINLKNLDLYGCHHCDSLPPNIYPAKLKLINCSFESLPIGLLHLEILFSNVLYKCNLILKMCWNQLVNLETLYITTTNMELLPEQVSRQRNLQNLQFKDCVNLRELPSNLHQLVNLHTLDISITSINSLPPCFVKLRNLQHLILPKCFKLKSKAK